MDHGLQTHYHYGIVAEIWVKYVPPDGFLGIQILRNSITAGTPPQTMLGSLRRSLYPWVGKGGGYPLAWKLVAFGTKKRTLDVPPPPNQFLWQQFE